MKKFIYLSLIVLLAACDKVDNPTPVVEGNADGLCTEPIFSPNTYTKRNILVEDLTGHFCPTCPPAAYSIDTIKNNLGKQVVPIGIHVTDQFAAPKPVEAPKFQTDFRTVGGTEIFNNFPPIPGLPAVMASRKLGFTPVPGRYNVYNFALSSDVRSLVGDVPKLKLQTISTFDASTNRVCTFAEVEITQVLADDHSIVFMLLEDSIVDWQKFAGGSGADPIYGTTARSIPEYVHKHVLRKTMNGWQGKNIITGGSVAIGDKIIEGSTFVITDGTWRTNHLEVVAFVYNNTTKEVVQAVSEKL